MKRVLILVLVLAAVALAKDEALHAYLKGADVPLVGLLELNNDLTEELLSLLKASRDPKMAPDVAGRRARLQAMSAKNAEMGRLIDARQAPPNGKELKLTLTRAHNRTNDVLAAMQKALDRYEGSDRASFARQTDKALKSLEAQRAEIESAAELYKKLAVKALIK